MDGGTLYNHQAVKFDFVRTNSSYRLLFGFVSDVPHGKRFFRREGEDAAERSFAAAEVGGVNRDVLCLWTGFIKAIGKVAGR
jgi:hypothetical protein